MARPRLVGMQNNGSFVMIAAAFAIIASVTLFGKGDRAQPVTTVIAAVK